MPMDLGNLASLGWFIPEIVLAVGVLVLIVVDLAISDKSILSRIAFAAAVASLILVLIEPSVGPKGAWLFHRMLVADSFAVFFRALVALAAVIAVWMSMGSSEVATCDQGEYYAILLSSAFG